MPWQTIILGRDAVSRVVGRLQNQFPAMVAAAGFPADAGIYERSDPTSATVEIFFTPAAVALGAHLFAQFGAVDCPEPDRSGLSVIFENATDRESG